VKLPNPPNTWGTDNLTSFIDNTRLNCFATYANLRLEYSKLNEIDGIFRKLAENLLNTRDWFAAFFMLRAHSAFLAGSHLAMSGQAAEAYAALRLCIENGLYGLYLARNPASKETWLRRHDNPEAKRRVREEFTIRRLLDGLRACNDREATLAEQLYERCIDYGGHPNERALTQSLKTEAKETTINLQIIYLSADPDIIRQCLRTAAQVGVSVLGIFRLVFKERFDLTGLTDQLNQVKKGL
jgi:hypothetical protein